MRELRIVAEGKSYVYQVPERYGEMNERQYRAAILKLMRLADRATFWEHFVGMPHRFCGSLPEWVLFEMEKMLEYNAYLLKENKSTDSKAELLELLRNMSAKERKALMKEAEK